MDQRPRLLCIYGCVVSPATLCPAKTKRKCSMPNPAPFVSKPMDIEKDWIDYNGHLNMAYYNVLFDRCSDEAFEAMGMGLDYVKERRLTIYTAEVHVCYVQELHLDHKVTVSFQLIDHDEKRLRAYQEIRH